MCGWSFFQKLRVNARKWVVESESELLNHFHFHFESFLDICFVIWCRDTTCTFLPTWNKVIQLNSIQFNTWHLACSFVAKLSWKKKTIFFLKIVLCFLQNIHYLGKKIFLYEKKVLIENSFYWKKLFLQRKIYMFILQKKLFWS